MQVATCGVPWDFSCYFHVPIPMCHRCCAGASETAHLQPLPEEDYAWATGVSLSGGAWECPPPQVDGQDPVVDVRVRKLSPLAVRQDRPAEVGLLLQSSLWSRWRLGFRPKPQLYLFSFFSCPVVSLTLYRSHLRAPPPPNPTPTYLQLCFQRIQSKREAEVGCEPRTARLGAPLLAKEAEGH